MGFFRKNFSTICLAISTIFLIFTFYKSHIVWDGERNYYYKLSYFIFGFFFLFSILSFFFSEKINDPSNWWDCKKIYEKSLNEYLQNKNTGGFYGSVWHGANYFPDQ